MKRLLVPIVVALSLVGCKGQQQPMANPFVGPTTVPPPGTNTYSNGPSNLYYPGVPNSVTPQPGVAPGYAPQGVPGNMQPVTPGAAPTYAPPGGSYNYGGGSAPGAGTPIPAHSAKNVPSTFSTEPKVTSASHNEEIRSVAIPRKALASTPKQPRLLNISEDAIEISNLPEAKTPAPAAEKRSRTNPDGFRLVSGSDEPDGSAVVTAAGVTASGKPLAKASYGHAPDYGWLRGKLEYSQIDRHWKLRYTPADGETDKFGGSVVISDASALAGLERGDFIEVHGKVGQDNPKNGFAPTYDVAKVERIAPAG